MAGKFCSFCLSEYLSCFLHLPQQLTHTKLDLLKPVLPNGGVSVYQRIAKTSLNVFSKPTCPWAPVRTVMGNFCICTQLPQLPFLCFLFSARLTCRPSQTPRPRPTLKTVLLTDALLARLVDKRVSAEMGRVGRAVHHSFAFCFLFPYWTKTRSPDGKPLRTMVSVCPTSI